MAKPALGRGLGALLGGSPVAKPPVPTALPTALSGALSPDDRLERVQKVPLDHIVPCPFQPRKDFAPDTLRELADSIKEQGIVQPLIVRERNGHLELIAGERRWRAAQLVGLTEVPVILRPADDLAVLELALIENLQRENLNPIEEAQGYAQLIDRFHLTQEDVATKVGKSRAVVTNALRLLKLSTETQACLRDGRLSVGHAKVILGGELTKGGRRSHPQGWFKRTPNRDSGCSAPGSRFRACIEGTALRHRQRRPCNQCRKPYSRTFGHKGASALFPGKRRFRNRFFQ